MATAAKIKPLNPRNADTAYVGDEPSWRQQPVDGRFTAMTRAFNWYNYFYNKKDAKDFVASYLDRRDRAKDAKKVRSTPDSAIVLTTGWLCRMVDMGLELNTKEQLKLDNMLDSLLISQHEVKVEREETQATVKTTIQDRLRDKVSECIGEIDGVFDDFVAAGSKMTADIKPVALMRGMNIAPQMSYMIADVWKKRLAEFQEAVEGRDGQLAEGYSNFSKIQMRNLVKFAEAVVNDCGAYVQIKKVERKPRKVKPVSPEKRAAKFRVLAEFAELKVKGLPAASLVDKSEAWLYDTKKRKLIHLVADSHTQAFTVKNNSVIGYSTAETLQKTVRKPQDVVKALQSAGKPAARKIFKDLSTTETAWNARGTENLLVLKSW